MAHFVPRVPLVQFAKSGVMNPFQDAVFTVSRVLFQHFPIPPTIGAIKGAKLDGPNLLVDAMEIGKEDAAALQALASECATKAELSARITAGGKASARLSKLLPRLADSDEDSQTRTEEACAIVDALLKPLEDGAGLQQAVTRPPLSGWSPVQKSTHALCSTALTAGCDLVAKCSGSDRMRAHDKQAGLESLKQAELDEHSMNALMPLLSFSLDSLRYPQVSQWHKRLAWHTATQLARTLLVVLDRPVAQVVTATLLPAPQIFDRFLLAESQPVLLPTQAGRLDGDESGSLLALTDSVGGTTVWTKQKQSAEFEFSTIGHAVLPRAVGPMEAAAKVKQLLDEIEGDRKALEQLDKLVQSGRQIPLPEPGGEVQFGKELAAVAQRIAAVQLEGPLLQPALKEVWQEAKKIEEQSAKSAQKLEERTQGKAPQTHPFALVDSPVTLLHGVDAWLRAFHQVPACDRVYLRGQHLMALTPEGWQDIRVLEPRGAVHRVQPLGTKGKVVEPLDIALHPWNHAPLQLPTADCEAGLGRYRRLLKARNASMTDALSGERLDIFEQSVPIDVTGATLEQQVTEVKGLAEVMLLEYDRRLRGVASSRACFVLVAEAATGKTVLMSQVSNAPRPSHVRTATCTAIWRLRSMCAPATHFPTASRRWRCTCSPTRSGQWSPYSSRCSSCSGVCSVRPTARSLPAPGTGLMPSYNVSMAPARSCTERSDRQ